MILQFHSKSALLSGSAQSGNFVSLKNHQWLPADALRRLSNFSEDSVEYDGNVYSTVEHAFQAQKYKFSNKPELVQMFYKENSGFPSAKENTGFPSAKENSGFPSANENSSANETIKTAAEAKTAGGKGGMKIRGAVLDVECWNNNRDAIMNALIKSKIQRNSYIRSILEIAATHNIKFVHFSRSDMYWGAHVNEDGTLKKGLNKLGEIYNQYINN
jgi:predicted NAD-dependent protein-ADP-ribosyltransferase YbiA (DUF1768 family)